MTPLKPQASTSPFKFLDAYGADDGKTFFGRATEIEALYALVMKSRLVLVYGPSGSGKTSLIQCGLANRFKPTDWFPVFVRRGEDLNASLRQRIDALATTPIDPAADVVAAARSLYLDFYRPVYFIFDQFEELFILQDDKPRDAPGTTEAASFFATIQALLGSDLNCKIIISMREEYIAWLQDFEAAVPTLFSSRLRVEQMTLGTVQEVIVDMTAAVGITLENGAQTARKITEQMGDRRVGVQLAYLQVYLDRLYREAGKTATPQLFTDALVAKLGELGDVMAEFLEEQTQAIADDVRSRHPSLPKGAVHRLLEALTTVEGTKQPVSRSKLAEGLPELAPMLDELLAALDDSRIIRRAGDMIEVSHDQLAKRIAERRSADSKAVALVQRLVRDRLAGYEQTRTWLAAEELAKVLPVLPQLGLSPAETDFVEKSRKKLRWRRVRLVGSTAALIAVLAGFGIYAGIQGQNATDAIVAASDTTSSIATRATELTGIADTLEVRRSLLEDLTTLNDQLEAIDRDATLDTGFWLDMLAGDIMLEDGDLAGARQRFVKGLDEAVGRRAALADDPAAADGADWPRNVAAALSRLAGLEEQAGKPDAALAYYRKALTIDEASLQTAADRITAQHDLMLSYGNFGDFERTRGRLESARQYLAKSVGLGRTLVKAEPDNRLWQRDLAYYQRILAKIYRDSGDLIRARTAAADSVARYQAIADAEPAQLDWRTDVVWGNLELAEIERRAGRWDAASAAIEAAAAAVAMLGPDQAGFPELLQSQLDAIRRRDQAPMLE